MFRLCRAALISLASMMRTRVTNYVLDAVWLYDWVLEIYWFMTFFGKWGTIHIGWEWERKKQRKWNEPFSEWEKTIWVHIGVTCIANRPFRIVSLLGSSFNIISFSAKWMLHSMRMRYSMILCTEDQKNTNINKFYALLFILIGTFHVSILIPFDCVYMNICTFSCVAVVVLQ